MIHVRHLVSLWRRLGRTFLPTPRPDVSAPPSSTADVHHLIAGHFDAAYYRGTNPDVAGSTMDPLDHFVTFGWREGRNPSRTFDVLHYLETYPDVARAGVNPLLHYVQCGQAEGRTALPRHATWRRQLARAKPPRARAENLPGAPVPATGSPAVLAAAFRSVPHKAGLILSLSHDDAAVACGGIQNVVRDEAAVFRGAGWAYLHVSPATHLSMIADRVDASAYHVSLRLDGAMVGTFTMADLLEAAASLRAANLTVHAIVHHLAGFVPELVLELFDACGVHQPVAWVHDYFSLCPGYRLLRNDVTYCDAPPLDSPACGICCNGSERVGHVARLHAFFERAEPFVLAPSERALALWRRRGALPHAGHAVLPLARLAAAPDGRGADTALSDAGTGEERPLRVAFLGAREFAKGWGVFEGLSADLAGDPRFEFWQLGTDQGERRLCTHVRHHHVRVGAGDRRAMETAVAELRVDVAIIWPLWPETFSYVVQEALAGGAFVVTNADAGNTWPAVAASGHDRGWALADERELAESLTSGRLRAHVLGRQRRLGVLEHHGGTAAWLLPREAVARRA